jgi:hypothetical protein
MGFVAVDRGAEAAQHGPRPILVLRYGASGTDHIQPSTYHDFLAPEIQLYLGSSTYDNSTTNHQIDNLAALLRNRARTAWTHLTD